MNPKPAIRMVLESGEAVISKRAVKATSETSIKALLSNYDEKPKEGVDFKQQKAAKLSEDLINSDIEINLELTGKFIDDVSRVYINEEEKACIQGQKSREDIFTPS